MCTSRTLTPRKQKPKKPESRPSQNKIKGDCKFNMFHIHALNNNAIYTIKHTMCVCELYLSHVIHHPHVSTAVTVKMTVIYKITRSPSRLLTL